MVGRQVIWCACVSHPFEKRLSDTTVEFFTSETDFIRCVVEPQEALEFLTYERGC